jgi:putative transposase
MDHGEAVALFRSEVVGVLTRLDLPRGEIAARLKTLSEQRFRPPGATTTRTFAVPTLERWYRLYKKGGLAALRPEPRADKGAARALTPEQQELVCEVRREHPSASAELILDTMVLEGRIDRDAISPSAVRRLFASRGLDRRTLRISSDGKQRLRWEAERPGALWGTATSATVRRSSSTRTTRSLCACTRCSTMPRATFWRSRRCARS